MIIFQLLRCGLGIEDAKDCKVCQDDWVSIYQIAREHAVLGIVFAAIDKLSQEQRPKRAMLLQWIALTEQIKWRNKQLNDCCRIVAEKLKSVGLECCILKGQGLSTLYPEPLLRQSGDIDAWVRDGRDSIDKSVGDIRKKVDSLKMGKVGKGVYHHLDWVMKEVEVEVHYRPHYFNNPIVNRRFQAWCKEQWNNRVDNGEYDVPAMQFNLVYLLAHMYHHLLFEGLKLKQVVDYYLVLEHLDASDTENVMQTIGRLRMTRFAKGVMWVMQEIFHTEPDKLIVEPDEREGRFILNEIMNGGDFGKPNEPVVPKFIRRTKYRSRFLLHYTSEILWDIPFRGYNFFWRVRQKKSEK